MYGINSMFMASSVVIHDISQNKKKPWKTTFPGMEKGLPTIVENPYTLVVELRGIEPRSDDRTLSLLRA